MTQLCRRILKQLDFLSFCSTNFTGRGIIFIKYINSIFAYVFSSEFWLDTCTYDVYPDGGGDIFYPCFISFFYCINIRINALAGVFHILHLFDYKSNHYYTHRLVRERELRRRVPHQAHSDICPSGKPPSRQPRSELSRDRQRCPSAPRDTDQGIDI